MNIVIEGKTITCQEDLAQFSNTWLVNLYNSQVEQLGRPEIKKFRDHVTAIARTWKVLEEMHARRQQHDAEDKLKGELQEQPPVEEKPDTNPAPAEETVAAPEIVSEKRQYTKGASKICTPIFEANWHLPKKHVVNLCVEANVPWITADQYYCNRKADLERKAKAGDEAAQALVTLRASKEV